MNHQYRRQTRKILIKAGQIERYLSDGTLEYIDKNEHHEIVYEALYAALTAVSRAHDIAESMYLEDM